MNPAADATNAVARQQRQTADRLSTYRVTASSPRKVVTVIYFGDFEIEKISCVPGASTRWSADELAGYFTSALRAGDRAVLALRQHAYSRVKLGDDTVAGWRQNPETGADTVAACFGGTTPTPRGRS
ncbi:hypothetical protein FB566_0611 [Stackebrandtia endophytica]|uniref:Uncharacterized protein n=1 Tax=Stackebrandtia endophytica TaxID=1496996 RepID=A0A543ARA2_9ACTN|nr:hypothetical protein [Stackebrandtia endophytica]TQL75118.1 hypothetical protein FB566_0611 [Stackebrandtia endophytica]